MTPWLLLCGDLFFGSMTPRIMMSVDCIQWIANIFLQTARVLVRNRYSRQERIFRGGFFVAQRRFNDDDDDDQSVLEDRRSCFSIRRYRIASPIEHGKKSSRELWGYMLFARWFPHDFPMIFISIFSKAVYSFANKIGDLSQRELNGLNGFA